MSGKVLLVITVVCLVGSSGVSAQNLLRQPESVVYDSLYSRYLVSNWDNGAIVQIAEDGTQSYFVSELLDAHVVAGLHIADSTLYAAVDSGPSAGVVGFDLATGDMVFRAVPPIMSVLNGITSDTCGYLYVTEFDANRLYSVRIADSSVATLVTFGLSFPNGIEYDAANHRLLYTNGGELWGPIMSYDLNDSTNFIAGYSNLNNIDGLDFDHFGNIYISSWATNTVYRFDSALSDTAIPVSTGHLAPADFYIDRERMKLIVPNFNRNSVDVVDLWLYMDSDTTVGEVPLEVTFAGSADLSVANWVWAFGDGDSSFVQDPSHIYDAAGLFDVTLTAVTTDGDTLIRRNPKMVAAMADTISVGDADVAYPDSAAEVTVSIKNDLPLSAIRLPVEFSGDLKLDTADISWSTAGCRTDGLCDVSLEHSDGAAGCMTLLVSVTSGDTTLNAGSGAILKLYFGVADNPQLGQQTTILTDGYELHDLLLSTSFGEYSATAEEGTITFIGCCEGNTGNCDCDAGGLVDIGDLTRLIDYLYISTQPLCCPWNGNIDGDVGGLVDIGDLTALISYLYIPPNNPPSTCL